MMSLKLLILLGFLSFAVENPKLEKAEQEIGASHAQAKKSQEKINQLDDQTSRMLKKYRVSLKQTENLKIYNEELKKYIKAQKEEISRDEEKDRTS